MAKKIKFRLNCLTPYGEFKSEVFHETVDKYNGLVEFSKNFHNENKYHQYLEDGTFMCLSGELIKQTMLLIEVLDD